MISQVLKQRTTLNAGENFTRKCQVTVKFNGTVIVLVEAIDVANNRKYTNGIIIITYSLKELHALRNSFCDKSITFLISE